MAFASGRVDARGKKGGPKGGKKRSANSRNRPQKDSLPQLTGEGRKNGGDRNFLGRGRKRNEIQRVHEGGGKQLIKTAYQKIPKGGGPKKGKKKERDSHFL